MKNSTATANTLPSTKRHSDGLLDTPPSSDVFSVLSINEVVQTWTSAGWNIEPVYEADGFNIVDGLKRIAGPFNN